jgi:preprotein translocase subunit YajC
LGRLKPWKLVLRIQGLFRVTAVIQMFFMTVISKELEAAHKEGIIEELMERDKVLIVIGLQEEGTIGGCQGTVTEVSTQRAMIK